jgi:hypothetical protein
VKRLARGWTLLVVLPALALVGVWLFAPGRRHEALDAFVLFLGALGLAACVRATRAASPDVHGPTIDDELDDPLDVLPQRPLELERLERDVYLSVGTAFYLHHRLLPLLREIAAERLIVRHGVDLARSPSVAAPILGEHLWSWLRPEREPPADRWAPGPPLAELRRIVDELETI